MNLSDYKHNILCPQDKVCYPVDIKHIFGNVNDANNILSKEGTTTLTYDNNDSEAPKLILDLGRASVGGHLVFSIKSFTGEKPVLRFAYSDWYDYIMEPNYCEIGDFARGCCKYLGVELPVLPADPNRFNQFTINRTGEYISPLVQGQQNWMSIKLETPGTSVEIEYAYFYYTSDDSKYDGAFSCSDPRLTNLWYASAWTCQIATIPNSNTWDNLNNTLLLRTLAKGNDAGFYKKGTKLKDYTLSFDGAIFKNPQMCSGIGALVRATDLTNGYAVYLNLDGTIQAYKRIGSILNLIASASVDFEVIDNKYYHFELTAKGDKFTYSINGKTYLEFTDSSYKSGSFGFCQTTEKWAVVKNLVVENKGKTIFADDFSGNLDAYEFTRSAPFVSDGAKRDRLPWIGDLDWAGRNIYYAFKDFKAMPETLRMFAFNQTAEGYIWGTCYPENTIKPAIGDYGYYESDLFSAWMLPTCADYLLFTDDKKFLEEIYPNLKADVDYLWRFVEADGLFNQRYATSKGLWDHVLNDMGKFTYNNLVVSEGFGETAYIAEKLGYLEDAKEFNRRKDVVRAAIKKYLTDDAGWLTKSTIYRDPCEMANSYALSIGYFEDKKDARAALDVLLSNTPGHGKITALMIRGAFLYGFDKEAISTLIQPGYKYVVGSDNNFVYDALENPNFNFSEMGMHPANWLKALEDWRGPMTTWECMTYPPLKEGLGNAWGDRSHPDTAVADILTSYILGILPKEAGFKTFTFMPHTAGLKNAEGIIPSTYGNIYASWKIEDSTMYISLETEGETALDCIRLNKNDAENFVVTVNGKTITAKSDDGEFIFY